jgi:hypothetical protein
MLRKCPPATITGHVFNAANGQVLPGATVRYDAFTFVDTDANGAYTLTGLAPNLNLPFTVGLSANKTGFFGASRTVEIFCGAHITLDFGAVDQGAATLHGKVTRASDGSPVAGAIVGGDWGKTATTAADGTYSFASVPIQAQPAGGWHVHAMTTGQGLKDANKTVTVTANHDSVLDFVLGADTNRRPTGAPQHFDLGKDTVDVDVTLAGTDADGDALSRQSPCI